jgi:hypothetical protein
MSSTDAINVDRRINKTNQTGEKHVQISSQMDERRDDAELEQLFRARRGL